MRWGLGGVMASDIVEIERRLWSVADQLRASSGLKPSEYSRPVLGLLFLRYADGRFAEVEKQLKPSPGSRLGPPNRTFSSLCSSPAKSTWALSLSSNGRRRNDR